jgi:signal transduction histidine kinase
LVDQIDSLSEIASAFSDFASMPRPAHEKLEVTSLFRHMLELYKDAPNVRILLKSELPEEEYYIYADKQQMIRVFHNLIRNSIQAIGESEHGEIILSVKRSGPDQKISISDNGTGIDPEQAEKIFRPSFTTKSSGMGLGLAIVRNIIHSFHGRIDFESDLGNGTTFHIYLPVYE